MQPYLVAFVAVAVFPATGCAWSVTHSGVVGEWEVESPEIAHAITGAGSFMAIQTGSRKSEVTLLVDNGLTCTSIVGKAGDREITAELYGRDLLLKFPRQGGTTIEVVGSPTLKSHLLQRSHRTHVMCE